EPTATGGWQGRLYKFGSALSETSPNRTRLVPCTALIRRSFCRKARHSHRVHLGLSSISVPDARRASRGGHPPSLVIRLGSTPIDPPVQVSLAFSGLGMTGPVRETGSSQSMSIAGPPSRASQIANSSAGDRIQPAAAAGILHARVT